MGQHKLFESRNGWKIGLKLWESCPSNCHNCNLNLVEVKYYKYIEHKENIEFIKNNFGENFIIFLSGTESVFHPELELFLEDSSLNIFQIYIHITPLYDTLRCAKIKDIYEKYPYVNFDTWYTIKSIWEMKALFLYLEFIIQHNINTNVSLFFDFSAYFKIINRFLENKGFSFKGMSYYENSKCLRFQYKGIEIHTIDNKKHIVKDGYISGITIDDCVAKGSFTVEQETVFIEREVEFSPWWIMRFHLNPYCNKAIQSISRADRSNWEVLQDFIKFDAYMTQYNSWDMGKNCFDCMSNPYLHTHV